MEIIYLLATYITTISPVAEATHPRNNLIVVVTCEFDMCKGKLYGRSKGKGDIMMKKLFYVSVLSISLVLTLDRNDKEV